MNEIFNSRGADWLLQHVAPFTGSSLSVARADEGGDPLFRQSIIDVVH